MDKKLILAILVIVIAGIAIYIAEQNHPITPEEGGLKQFASETELKDFLNNNREQMSTGFGNYGMMYESSIQMTKTASAPMDSSGGSTEYSRTNVQVEGVDEPDIVKNDGNYIYMITGNKLVIVDAYPAANAKILSETALNGNPRNIFLNKDKLVVFGARYDYEYGPLPLSGQASVQAKPSMMPIRRYESRTYIEVYNIKDRSNPVLKRNFTITGNYFDARMIGNHAYAVVNLPAYYYGDPILLPYVSENNQKISIPASEIYYFDFPDYSYSFSSIISINIMDDKEASNIKTYLTGSSQNMFVSTENIYLSRTMENYWQTLDKIVPNVIEPVLPENVANRINEIANSNTSNKWASIEEEFNKYLDSLSEKEKTDVQSNAEKKMAEFQQRMMKEREKTAINKISISDGKIKYVGQGTVPGTVLNQFSMDEHDGYFRIATTTGNVWSQGVDMAKNHIYILDKDMEIAGMVKDLAPGERIYSARFIGDRAYLVTFKKVDPLFVIDMKDPKNPKVLGKLKIPGYSDYLHPYDENHIIGIGKEAVEAEEGDFAWYQGIKLALFDVSDPQNPREISKYNIGDRGTDSFALNDHKAFLFDRQKNLLVIPVTVAEIDESKYANEKVPANMYGDYVFQGAYVLNLDTQNGFQLKGKVTHVEDDSLLKSGSYYYSDSSVKRSLYIDNVLYTVSDAMIKANDLDSMNEISKIKLPRTKPYYEEMISEISTQ